VAATILINRRPPPGQPRANDEKRRRKIELLEHDLLILQIN